MQITYFHRKPGPTHFSLERVFEDVRAHLPADIRAVVARCPRESKRVLNRIINILWAWRHQGEVNHITGDVHYLCYLLPKRRTVLTIADCVSLKYNRGLKRSLLWFFWYWLPIRRAHVITVISQFTKDDLLAHVECPPKKVVVIHCPVSDAFSPKPKPLGAEEPVLLQIGTGRNKNLERVAAALRGIPCRLIIIGALDEAQCQCLAENGIQFNHYQGVSDEMLANLYGECDLLVFASLYEGFGLPIVEAQAIGRPVVTSNRCSMPEVAGDAACLVDPESVESIREGILRTINDEDYRADLIRRGYENTRRFAPAVIARQYVALYKEMAST